MNAPQPSPPPQTKPAPAAVPRRPWYRLHWSTWIVVAAVLAFFALVNIPSRGNNHGIFFVHAIFYEHGWPFVFMDRCYPASPPKAFDESLEKARAKTFFPWAESPSGGNLNERFEDGDPIWLNKSNWDFTGKWYIYQRWLAVDILFALIATVPFAAAYEFWSRRRWRYSLRFLLICVFLVAAGMAWWRTGVNNYEREMKAVITLQEKGYNVSLHCDAPVFLQIFVGKNNLRPFTHVDKILGLLLYSDDLQPYHLATDADLEHIGDLTRLVELYLLTAPITDKTLERLHDLVYLTNVNLSGTKITDAGLQPLVGLPNLNALDFSGTKVTDEGLRHFAGMTKLTHLFLNGTQVTDAGLKFLENMKQLKRLEINGTKVTSEGIDKLQRALPNCLIQWEWEVTNPNETEQPTPDAEDDAGVDAKMK